VQEDLAEELRWDLRALAAADELTDRRAREHHHSLAVAGFYPSLHLNLADVHRRLGDEERARDHLTRAEHAVDTLGDDGLRPDDQAGHRPLRRPSELLGVGRIGVVGRAAAAPARRRPSPLDGSPFMVRMSGMNVSSVAVGFPVKDLGRAVPGAVDYFDVTRTRTATS
jgi:hypothetical protein